MRSLTGSKLLKTLPVATSVSTSPALGWLDRLTLAYVALPLLLFLPGWFQLWLWVPLLAALVYTLLPDITGWRELPRRALRSPQIMAITLACVWTVLGGTAHLFYANADWHTRDAVLHDLVVAPWPVGYGPWQGTDSLLRTTLGYFLPAALFGKLLGVSAAHYALMVWTALGTSLFLLQVQSLLPAKRGASLALLVVVLFSGLDVIGWLLGYGERFIRHWTPTMHLEWWALFYQYSSMTTQLFWVPNHALAGWLAIGLLLRHRRDSALDALLPLLMVAVLLWSPLTAAGLAPFVLWQAGSGALRERSLRLLHPKVWLPALLAGVLVAAYLTLDSGGIDKGLASNVDALRLLRLAQFFLLEAGLIGFAVLAIRPEPLCVLALLILAGLPFVHLGPSNDLVMRASIPALTVLAIDSCLALFEPATGRRALVRNVLLPLLLVIGAVTPLQEIARAVRFPRWPANLEGTLVGASCGTYPPHYVAHISAGPIQRMMRAPHAIGVGPVPLSACENPAEEIMNSVEQQ